MIDYRRNNGEGAGSFLAICVLFAVLSCGGFRVIARYQGKARQERQDTQYSHLFVRAADIAYKDKNNPSLEDKIRFYQEMGIEIEIPGTTRKPTLEELQGYILKKTSPERYKEFQIEQKVRAKIESERPHCY